MLNLLIDYLLFALLGVGWVTGLLIWGLGCKHVNDEFGQPVGGFFPDRVLTKVYAIMLLWTVIFWVGWSSLVIERGTIAGFWLCLGWLAYFYWYGTDKDVGFANAVQMAGIWLVMFVGVIFLVWLYDLAFY